MTIWCKRIACWIHTATNTHSEYVIFIALPLQQWFTNVPQCYFIRTSPFCNIVLYWYLAFSCTMWGSEGQFCDRKACSVWSGGIKKGTTPPPPPLNPQWLIRHKSHNEWRLIPQYRRYKKKGQKRNPQLWSIRHTCHKLSKKFWRKRSQRLIELVHYLQGTLRLWL
jgi:hypothetical protein